MGYLQYTEIKKDGKVYFQIHKRDPDLNLNNTQPPLEVVEDEEENSGSSVLEGELCPPADPIDGDDVLTVHDLTAEELRYIRSLRSQKRTATPAKVNPAVQAPGAKLLLRFSLVPARSFTSTVMSQSHYRCHCSLPPYEIEIANSTLSPESPVNTRFLRFTSLASTSNGKYRNGVTMAVS